MIQSLDKKKIGLFFLAILCGIATARYGQPLIHKNNDAINIIVTVFSILAGFLVAVITLVGDVSTIPSGSWRVAQQFGDQTKARLIRHRDLFILYLLTLGLIFIGSLLKELSDIFLLWLERVYMFFAGTAFVFSLSLPHALMTFQEERLQAEIDRRRQEENIPEDTK